MSKEIEWIYNFEAGNPDSFILDDDGSMTIPCLGNGPIKTWNDPPITCDACEAEVDGYHELYAVPFIKKVFVCGPCINGCGGILSEQLELGYKAKKLKEVKR